MAYPTNGYVMMDSDGSFYYTPNSGFSGQDTFTYSASDGTAYSNSATVTINVTNQAPVAVGDSYSIHQGLSLNVDDPGLLANDGDPDNVSVPIDSLTVEIWTYPTNGYFMANADGSFYYTPNTGFTGQDSFTYRVFDGAEYSNTVTATFNVTNQDPTANPQSFAVLMGQTYNGLLTGSDPDVSDLMQFAVIVNPSDGYLMVDSITGAFSYSPANPPVGPSYAGPDSFSFQVFDGQAHSAPATVAIAIGAGNNTAPSIESVTLDSYSPKTDDQLIAQVVNATDPDGDTITYHYVWYVNGIAVRDVTKSLTQDWLDLSEPGQGSKNDEIFLTVTPMDPFQSGTSVSTALANVINSAPVALQTQVYLQAYEQRYDFIDFLANVVDPDGDPVYYQLVISPQYGTLVYDASSELYDYVATGYNGIDNFAFNYSDGSSYSQDVSCKVLSYDETTDFATDEYAFTFETVNGVAFNGAPDGMGVGQGAINDCWLIAAGVGLAQAEARGRVAGLLGGMIVDNGPAGAGRSYSVTYPGRAAFTFNYVTGETHVNPANAARPFALSTTNNNNGDWMAILEKGLAYALAPSAPTWSATIAQTIDVGRNTGYEIRQFTGDVDPDDTWCTRDSTTRSKLTTLLHDGKKIVTAGAARPGFGLVERHCYTVLDYDAATDRVHIRNPWGHNTRNGANVTTFTQLYHHQATIYEAAFDEWRQETRCAANVADFWMPLVDFTAAFREIAYEK